MIDPQLLELHRRVMELVKVVYKHRKDPTRGDFELIFARADVLEHVRTCWIAPMREKRFVPLFRRWLRQLSDGELDGILNVSNGVSEGNQKAWEQLLAGLAVQLAHAGNKWLHRDIGGRLFQQVLTCKPKNEPQLLGYIRSKLGPGGVDKIHQKFMPNTERPTSMLEAENFLGGPVSGIIKDVRDQRLKKKAAAKGAANQPAAPKKEKVLL